MTNTQANEPLGITQCIIYIYIAFSFISSKVYLNVFITPFITHSSSKIMKVYITLSLSRPKTVLWEAT